MAAARRASRSAREDVEEPAELLVSLQPAETHAYGAETWTLKLRVRRGKASYVVKNVGELVHAWETRSELSYGKNLSFVHSPGAFDERARAILDLTARVVHSQQALFASRWRYWDAGRGTPGRTARAAPSGRRRRRRTRSPRRRRRMPCC